MIIVHAVNSAVREFRLSAVIGRRAGLVLRHPQVERVSTPSAAYDEVLEYLPSLARKKQLDLDTVLLACAALPVVVVERAEYHGQLAAARRRIAKRDPDDVDVLALALSLDVAVWSKDNDFEDCGVEWHTTAELLKELGIQST